MAPWDKEKNGRIEIEFFTGRSERMVRQLQMLTFDLGCLIRVLRSYPEE